MPSREINPSIDKASDRQGKLSQIDPILGLIRDPLSEPARDARKLLLGLSAVAVVCVVTGLVPTQIETLGISFTETDQRLILGGIGAVIFYAMISFGVYSRADYLAASYLRERIESVLENDINAGELAREIFPSLVAEQYDYHAPTKKLRKHFPKAKLQFTVRNLIDFLLPILVGLIAIAVLVWGIFWKQPVA